MQMVVVLLLELDLGQCGVYGVRTVHCEKLHISHRNATQRSHSYITAIAYIGMKRRLFKKIACHRP